MKREWRKAGGILSDRASALSEMCFACGALIGPVLGGFITQKTEYWVMTDIFCLISIGVCVLNFLFVFVLAWVCGSKKAT